MQNFIGVKTHISPIAIEAWLVQKRHRPQASIDSSVEQNHQLWELFEPMIHQPGCGLFSAYEFHLVRKETQTSQTCIILQKWVAFVLTRKKINKLEYFWIKKSLPMFSVKRVDALRSCWELTKRKKWFPLVSRWSRGVCHAMDMYGDVDSDPWKKGMIIQNIPRVQKFGSTSISYWLHLPRVNIKHIWNHHLVVSYTLHRFCLQKINIWKVGNGTR